MGPPAQGRELDVSTSTVFARRTSERWRDQLASVDLHGAGAAPSAFSANTVPADLQEHDDTLFYSPRRAQLEQILPLVTRRPSVKGASRFTRSEKAARLFFSIDPHALPPSIEFFAHHVSTPCDELV